MAASLPPLNAVRAFQAAARHLNFSRAAEELGVTQGAVSKQVNALENYIGSQLFIRQASGLELTVAGHSLKVAILPAFDMLETAFAHYQRREPRSRRFRIATVGSFAAQTLVPRIDRFSAEFPDLDIEIHASDRLLDLDLEEIDFSIRYGMGGWKGLSMEELSGRTLVPVCHPDLLPTQKSNFDDWIKSQRRIQAFSKDEWKDWTVAASSSFAPSSDILFLEDFLVALRSVQAAQGVGLLPDSLIAEPVLKGELKVFSPITIEWPMAYFLAYLPGKERNRRAASVMTWLKQDLAEMKTALQEQIVSADHFS